MIQGTVNGAIHHMFADNRRPFSGRNPTLATGNNFEVHVLCRSFSHAESVVLEHAIVLAILTASDHSLSSIVFIAMSKA